MGFGNPHSNNYITLADPAGYQSATNTWVCTGSGVDRYFRMVNTYVYTPGIPISLYDASYEMPVGSNWQRTTWAYQKLNLPVSGTVGAYGTLGYYGITTPGDYPTGGETYKAGDRTEVIPEFSGQYFETLFYLQDYYDENAIWYQTQMRITTSDRWRAVRVDNKVILRSNATLFQDIGPTKFEPGNQIWIWQTGSALFPTAWASGPAVNRIITIQFYEDLARPPLT